MKKEVPFKTQAILLYQIRMNYEQSELQNLVIMLYNKLLKTQGGLIRIKSNTIDQAIYKLNGFHLYRPSLFPYLPLVTHPN